MHRTIFDIFPGALACCLLILCGTAAAQVFLSQEAALERAFADADTVERHTLFLADSSVAQLSARARTPIESPIVVYYTGRRDGAILGHAFFETRVVRTKEAVVMTVISPDATVESVTVLAFFEPMDYLPIPRWLERFTGKALDDRLVPGQGVDAVSGATLTTRAISDMVRRALVLVEFNSEVSR